MTIESNYTSIEDSKKLRESGIILETDAMWIPEDGKYFFAKIQAMRPDYFQMRTDVYPAYKITK